MKVKIGKSLGRRSVADLGFDNSTTASFGACQPIMCKEMVPNTTYEVEVDSLVRLSPLVKPTFGRVKYKVWHNFVPLADIYKPFESMLSQTPYTTSQGVEYIPTHVPQLKLSDLSRAVYTLDFFVTPYYGHHSGSSGSDYTSGLYGTGHVGLPNLSAVTSGNTTHKMNAGYLSGATDAPWVTSLRSFSATSSSATINYNDNWGFIFKDSSVSAYTPYVADPVSCDMLWYRVVQTGSSDYDDVVYCQKLTDRQRRLRKVLLGLGYNLDINNDGMVSVLPLIAYYKAWFNTLFPERYQTWTQTNAFKLMEAIADYGNNVITAVETHRNLFAAFLADVCDCFYFDDADFYSAHLTGTSVAFNETAFNYQDGDNSQFSPESTGTSIISSANWQPSYDMSNNLAITDTTIRLLRILTKFVNKNTQIGGKIAEYLKAHYGAELINNLLENYFIGGDSVDVVISDVMSNASTDGAELGDFSGKGIGYKDGKSYKYTAKSFGYWITFSAIVPRSNWYQGIDPLVRHRGRFEFFTPEFDAVGFVASPKSYLITNEGIGTNGLSGASYSNSKLFGYIPRYSEYKLKTKNIVNGDITLPSTRNDLMPYTLDKTFTPFEVDGTPNTGGSVYSDVKLWKFPAVNALANNLDLRRIGYKSEYGNYDRIFYSNESAEHQLSTFRNGSKGLWEWYSLVDDNFIIHHIINVDAKIPMLPMSESFDTGGSEEDAMSVDKV